MTTRGTRGEKAFDLLCSDAGLIVNPSREDMAGWDFFVQFPLDATFNSSIDHRPPPISAFFQVKTSKELIKLVCIKVSNAERMVTEVKPTFFALGLDNGEGKSIRFEVGHIGASAIAHILAALRKNFILPYSKRKKSICISRDILEISSAKTPDELRAAIIDRSQGSVESYVNEKIKLTKSAGYDKNAYSGSFSLRGATADDKLISLMIGEIDELKVQKFSVTETRFGISIKLQSSVSAVLKVEPSEKEFGIVEFVSRDGAIRAEFECEIRSPNIPDIREEKFRIRISNEVFSFSFGPHSGFTNWRSNPNTRAHLPWDNLKNLVKFLHLSTLGKNFMNVYIRGHKAIEAEFTSSSSSRWNSRDLIETISIIDFMHTYPALRSYLRFSGSEFVRVMNNKSALFALLRNRESNKLEVGCTTTEDPKGNPNQTIFLFPLGFVCGGKLVSMTLLVEGISKIQGKNVKMTVQNVKLDGFGAFDNRTAALTSLKAYTTVFCNKMPDSTLIIVEESIRENEIS